MNLLILGASARSAAFSAIRMGLQPICADLFGDHDLTSICPSTRVDPSGYPEALSTYAATLEPTPWLYTGAIENRPDLVERISTRHPLLGNAASTLRAVRDPFLLGEAFRDAGLAAPEVRADAIGLPRDGSWLVKPLASGGGRGIRLFLSDQTVQGRSVYFQQRIDGHSLAALYAGEGVDSRCLGITRQFVGRPGCRFAYRGSLGPWPVVSEVQEQIERLGGLVASRFGLLGLFGIDLILSEGRAWPIEVNPRYTASVEVLEWALGHSLLADHLRAFGHDFDNRSQLSPSEPGRDRIDRFVGKTILFAVHPGLWSPSSELPLTDPHRLPEIADIPQSGTKFQAGDPVLTVFEDGSSPEDCRRNLAARVREWKTRLGGMST